jgi:putative SOS response-associated peptidase YedK
MYRATQLEKPARTFSSAKRLIITLSRNGARRACRARKLEHSSIQPIVYGFLTTAPNAIVEPIHPKAMPVILTTDEEARRLDARAVG